MDQRVDDSTVDRVVSLMDLYRDYLWCRGMSDVTRLSAAVLDICLVGCERIEGAFKRDFPVTEGRRRGDDVQAGEGNLALKGRQ